MRVYPLQPREAGEHLNAGGWEHLALSLPRGLSAEGGEGSLGASIGSGDHGGRGGEGRGSDRSRDTVEDKGAVSRLGA